jgi:hypothetical protein
MTIRGKEFAVEKLLYETYEMEYLDLAKEDIVSLTVMADGAGLSADIPVRLLGERILLTDRDAEPGIDGLFYTFFLSERDDGDDEYGDWVYCRLRSWLPEDEDDRYDDYAGWFAVRGSDKPSEWIVEWELIAGDNWATVSTGYIEGVFELIP